MQRVYLTSDYDSHKYIIPYELKGQFEKDMEQAYETEEFDKVEELYGKYTTGGDYNQDDLPLYANI